MYRNVALLVLLVLALCAFGEASKDQMRAAKAKCAAELGIDPSTLKGPPPTDESEVDPKKKCLAACIMKQLGAMSEDGTVDVEKAIELLPPDMPDREKAVEAIKECSTKKGGDECETAREIHKCLREKNVFPKRHHRKSDQQ